MYHSTGVLEISFATALASRVVQTLNNAEKINLPEEEEELRVQREDLA
jgi:hypothetical protein